MLLLSTTSDVLRLITSEAVAVDVIASYVDLSAGTATPNRQWTAITTATTTTVVSAPAASTVRNVKTLFVRNKSAADTVTVTVEVYNGSTAFELYEATLGPGQSAAFMEGRWFVESSRTSGQPWETQLLACTGNGDPGVAMMHMQRAGNIAATPTNITTSIARCSAFSPRQDITINRIRAYGVAATTNVYRVAIYRYSDRARLTTELAFTTAPTTWVSIGSALALTLSAGTVYFVAVAVNATGTTAGCGCIGTTVNVTTGRVTTAPASLPGSLAVGSGYLGQYNFQFAVTTGALPATANTLDAQAQWAGGMPAFFLDAADV